MASIFALVKDPYDRKARLTPGLLVVLPLLVPLVCVYGTRNPVLAGVVALFSGCGAMFALANITREQGKRIEEKLIKEWGGMPTTIALRHCDKVVLDSVSKARYHSLIEDKLGIKMPTVQEESSNPEGADDAYVGATKLLRERTRSNKQLLFKENISYGFHRNMLGMKPAGIVVSLAGIVYGLLLSGLIQFRPLSFEWERLAEPGLAAGLTLLVGFTMLVCWLFFFNRDAVWRIGVVYAERLFECLPSLAGPRKKAVTKQHAGSSQSS